MLAGLVVAYQLAVTLLRPTWEGPATDWLRAALAWPALLTVVLVSLRSTRTRQPAARSWWLLSLALLFYTVARNLWTVENQFVYPSHVPYPGWPDLFYLLQYPCVFLALILLPRTDPWGPRARVVLDACLLMGAALALSWYFFLAPIELGSRETLPGKLVNLSVPLGDLAIVFGLIVLFLHQYEIRVERTTVVLLLAAIICLFVADSWLATQLLTVPSYQAGTPPDLFWLASYLLILLAGLVQLRVPLYAVAGTQERPARQQPYRRRDLFATSRFLLPIAAALLTGVVILDRAILAPIRAIPPLDPVLIVWGLMALVLLRQGLSVLDNERIRRERDEALQATTAQMETFLGVAGHELRTPLTGMLLGLQVVEQRIRRLLRRESVPAADVASLLEPVERAERQEARMDRLVNDLVDVARVRAGRLVLDPAPTDLAAVVREAVEEQRQANPERTILLEGPDEQRVAVIADAHRVGQVVTNYLTNALKYSPADRPVAVGILEGGRQARVWVRDAGPGLPPEEQERIWERFYRARGIEVQSGTGVGLGLGLHVSRSIIEQQHGRVGVQSAPGQGSTFWFTLPLATPGSEQESGAPEGLGC